MQTASLEQVWTPPSHARQIPTCQFWPGGNPGQNLNPQQESARGGTRQAKTDVVVRVAAIVPVARRRTTIPRIVVPGTATFNCLPRFQHSVREAGIQKSGEALNSQF